jgi:Ca2+-binding RTX toxin-like protein
VPADDGNFAYLTEYVSGTSDFSDVTDNLHLHGSGDNDTITGGRGNDVIDGGHGNDVIHANAGDNLIIGGAGDDVMYGGDGLDTFFWDISHFGQGQATHDVIWDFEYGKDLLTFNDVFDQPMSQESILDMLGQGNGEYAGNTLSLDGNGFSMTAEFSDNGVVLNIIDDTGAAQRIDVNFDTHYTTPGSEEEATAFLSALISRGMA